MLGAQAAAVPYSRFNVCATLRSSPHAQKKLKTAATNPVERGTVKKADPSWLEGTSAGKKK
jgi:hypothetical protein